MDAGDCLFFPDDNHLWIIISDPRMDANELLLVNVTTYVPNHPHKDKTCLLQAGDHPFIRHLSCVNYADARIATDAALERGIARNIIVLHDTKLDSAVLRRIRMKALFSPRMARDHQDILIVQGLAG